MFMQLLKEVGALHELIQILYFLVSRIQKCYWASEDEIKNVGHRAKFRKKGHRPNPPFHHFSTFSAD